MNSIDLEVEQSRLPFLIELEFVYDGFQREDKRKLPCEQRFLSCMAFGVYEVVGVACL